MGGCRGRIGIGPGSLTLLISSDYQLCIPVHDTLSNVPCSYPLVFRGKFKSSLKFCQNQSQVKSQVLEWKSDLHLVHVYWDKSKSNFKSCQSQSQVKSEDVEVKSSQVQVKSQVLKGSKSSLKSPGTNQSQDSSLVSASAWGCNGCAWPASVLSG